MARKVITTTELTDDLDGGKADRTVQFSWDGVSYEIDLSKRNATTFEKTVAPYVGAARKVRGSARRSPRARAAASLDLTAVREWAKQNGFQVSERGRVATAVVDAYRAAH